MTDRISTHADGCWDWGPKHYECAVGKIEQLEERVQRDEALLRQALDALERSETTVPYEGFGILQREAIRKHAEAITALKERLT